jgi:hypothetical protein
MATPETKPAATHPDHDDQDWSKGVVESDRPSDGAAGKDNAPALNDEGMPSDPIAIAQDQIGANEDQTQG